MNNILSLYMFVCVFEHIRFSIICPLSGVIYALNK